MERQQYIQDLVNQNLTDEEIFAKLDEFDNDTDPPKKITDPLKQETSTGSTNDMVSKSVDGSLGLQSPSMGPVASLEEQFGFEPPKDIERMQEVKITVPRSREDLTWLEKKFGKNKVTDFFGDIIRSWESGWTSGESVDVNLELWKEGTTREEINSFIQMDERLSKVKSTDELIEFEEDYQKLVEEDGAVMAFFEGWFKNPEAMLQTSMQSASMMVSSLVNSDEVGANAITGLTTGGGVGAGVGSVVPGIGTIAGGLTGAASGAQGAISGTMEVGFTMAELVKEKAIENLKESGSDKNWNELSSKKRGDLVYEILSNKKTKQELKDRALARGITIGGFDAISGAVTMGAGRFASGAAKKATRTAFKSSSKASQAVLRTTAKAAPTAARFTTETGISMVGEGAGQLAAGQELDVKEILTEGFADKTFTTIGLGKDVAVNTFSKGKYKINGQNLSFNKFANEIKAMDDIAFSSASIDVKNDDVVDAIINNRAEDIRIDQGIDSKISDVNDRSELIKLERDIKQLSAGDSETNKNRVAKLKERVKEISEAYADAEIDIDIEDRKNAVAQASRNKVEREFNDNAKKVEQAAEDIKDLEILKFDTTKEVEEYLASREGDEISSKASGQQGFIIQDSSGKQTIVLNKEVAVKDNAVTVASHELLHGLLFSTINKNPNNAVRLGDALLKRLNNIDINKIKDSKFKERMELYADESRDIKMEEALTLFSDALATGDIKYNENVFTKVGDVIRRTLQRNNKINIKFNNGRDVYNFIKDYNNSIQEGKLSLAQEKLAKEGATGRLISEQKETEDLTVKESKAKATVLEEINNLIPENVETKEQFLSDRSFTKVYESAMSPGGAINNYIKSRTTSAMEAELAVDSVLERLMNFDPQAKRKDGSTIGREGFGEFIFANTAFGKLDAKKKLFQESERRSKETRIDDSTKQIADVETVEEQEVEIKEKPKINPLKFTGVPADLKLSDKPGKGLTFKKVAKQYAGEVGEQAIGIPAKKITESAANLGSVNEARAIQQFFFKADNLDKFVKILPETNIALPETQIGIETIDVSKGVQGTGLGLPKRILDYFYEDFIDPTGKLTSPKGRSKGLTSQTAVKRLKPEFRGVVSKETIDKIKKDIGITPKGELNILPKGELRSPIGQLLKGMAKTYSTLAANTLVRQEMETAGATKQEIADVAAGKPRVMLSKGKLKESKNVFMQDDSFVKSSDEFAAENKVWKAILKPLGLELPSSKDAVDIEEFREFAKNKLTRVLPKSFFTGGTFANAGSSAAKRGFFFVSKEDINSIIDGMEFAEEDADIASAVNRESYKNLDSKINTTEFRKRQDQSIEGLRKIFKAFSILINENPENAKYIAALLSSSSQGMAHFIRTSAPITFYSKVLNGKVEEHTLPASLVGKYLFNSVLNGTLDFDFENIRKNYQQGLLSKVDDKKLKGFKPNGKPYNYIASTPEGWKITDNIFGRYFNENVANNNGGIDPNNIVLYNGNTIVEEYGINNKGFATTVGIENEAKKAFKNNSKIMFSKASNNSELLNNLKNRDAAIRSARNMKAPIKGISVFDFDDTLATTKSMVGVTMPDGTETKIDATEFAKTGEDLLEQGATFDFSDFSKVVGGEPGPLIAKLDKAIKKFGNKDVFVLTARPANSALAIYEFLKGLGYEIPLENITGLANSSPEAKAQWMVDKAAEGYNDFYFTDDAYKNVKAVQDAMKVLDVKSKERIVYKDAYEKLDKEFNDILEAKTGIASEKRYSDAKAEVIGVSKGKFNFFISPSAEDFVGLLYSTLSKGKLGENQMAWYKKNLLDPYTRAMNNIANERMALSADYKALKKQLGVVPKKLKQKIKGEGFNKEQAVRIYIWNKQGFDVPGLSKTDLADMTKYVEKDATLQVFADQLVEITKGDGYAAPGESWMAGSITTDLLSTLQVTKRAKHLEEWQQNVDVIFSKENLNKMEAAYGSTYRGAMENMLQRMKSGKNRNFDGDSLTGKFLDWVNGSTGAIMFFNTRSAVLQTISAVNFINWSDNNVFKASAAFANQKQYWKDFMFLFNSDFLKERRDNLTINVNEADIAEMANKGGAKGALAYLLQKGFLPTQIADGFAIASGGSTFYRNRIKTYLKEGMSEKEAETKAFEDFREAAEESQQSSRPDRISQQQAGPLGRVVLAFANTPSQYARIIKKASLDLANNRGDFKTNLSKIMYYSVIQGVIFTSLQSALFAADFDDEEEMEDRIWKMSNSVVDGIMRGAGVQGAVTSVVKNATLKAIEESEKKSPKYNKVVNEIVRISPPVSSKISKLQQAAREVQWNREEMETKGFSLDNPAWLAAGNVISATTNVPADRVIKKINNVDYALSQELELYERLALLGGWQKWELGLDKKEKEEKRKSKSKFRDVQYRTTKYNTIKYK